MSKRTTRSAVFLDRDGTIIEDVGHITSPRQVQFFPDTIKALRFLSRFRLFIITNQPGVAEGVISRSQLDRVNAFIMEYLASNGIKIEHIYYCPHARSDGCSCIKPNPYYIKKAKQDYGLDLARSYVVGDHPHDVIMSQRVGARGIYLLTGHGQRHRHQVPEGVVILPGILEAARWILSSGDNVSEDRHA